MLCAVYFFTSRPEAKPRDVQQRVRTVKVVEALRHTAVPQITNYGEVIAVREAEFRAMVAGRLVDISEEFKDGAIITAGAQVAEIDRFEFELATRQAQANLSEAEAKLSELRTDLAAEKNLLQLTIEQITLRQRDRDRSADLVNKGQTSKKALDDANIALNIALEAREQRTQSVARASAKITQQLAAIQRLEAALSQARRNLDDTKLIAPFTGFVTDTKAALGKRLAVGESVGRLISSENLQVRFQLNNDDYARLIAQGKNDGLIGREVAIIWRLGAEEFSYQARIERRAAEIDPSSGGVTVYAGIENAGAASVAGDTLRPGAFVEVSFSDISYPNVLALPQEAIIDGTTVFVVNEGILDAVQVDVIRHTDHEVLVTTEPNIPLENSVLRVVAAPFPGIGPGLRVKVAGE